MTDTEIRPAADVVLRTVPTGQVHRARVGPERSRASTDPPVIPDASVAGPCPDAAGEAEIPLDVLLRSVRLTPRQTAFVAMEIVHALGVRHESGSAHGSVATTVVRVGLSSGRVRLMDPEIEEEPEDWLLPATPPGVEQLRRDDLIAAAATVAGLTDDTRTPAAQRDPRRLALLTALDDLGAVLTAAAHGTAGGGIPPRLAALAQVAEPRGRRPGAREELAALAATVGRLGPPDGQLPRHAGAPCAADPAQRAAPAPPASRPVWAIAQQALARFSVLLVSLAVLGLVIGLEFTLLGDKLTGDLRRLTGAGSGADAKVEQAAPGAARGLPPLPVLGPRAAGSVTGIELRAVGVCKPGSRCPLRIVVAVRPPRAGLSVGWSVVVVDRCTGARTAGPSGKIRVPAGGGTGSAFTEVRLPRGVLAVVAETSKLARTAGKALPVPARSGSC